MARALVMIMAALLLGQQAGVWPAAPTVLFAQQAAAPAPAAMVNSPLDYEVFKTKVQPILMSARKGNARCIACHAGAGGNSYLEPLAAGAETYTEEQTRRNFARVAKLVVPGEPMKSILLMNPLATEAGGSHWHGGGKHFQTQDNPEWATIANWVRTKTPPPAPALNYETFKSKVQPILMSARKGNARCIACHAGAGGNSYLEPLAAGTETYTDEQTRRNFARVSKLVVLGQPMKSILLMNPLATEAGGSHWHGGGKHFQTRDNVEWKVLEAWANGS